MMIYRLVSCHMERSDQKKIIMCDRWCELVVLRQLGQSSDLVSCFTIK